VLYLSNKEAAELYELWHEKVERAVRRAHAKANGRRDTHDADLTALRRDLTAVNLHTLEIPEPDAAPGTALAAAQSARRFLTCAQDDHARAEHLPAILWLQSAYMGAELAAALDKRATAKTTPPDQAPHAGLDAIWQQQFNIPRQRQQ